MTSEEQGYGGYQEDEGGWPYSIHCSKGMHAQLNSPTSAFCAILKWETGWSLRQQLLGRSLHPPVKNGITSVPPPTAVMTRELPSESSRVLMKDKKKNLRDTAVISVNDHLHLAQHLWLLLPVASRQVDGVIGRGVPEPLTTAPSGRILGWRRPKLAGMSPVQHLPTF